MVKNPICSMYDIFITYMTGCFLGQMLVTIPAPWSIWDMGSIWFDCDKKTVILRMDIKNYRIHYSLD